MVTASGSVSSASGEPLETSGTSTHKTLHDNASVLQSFCFDGAHCPYIPSNPAAVVVTVLHSNSGDHGVILQVSAFNDDGNVDDAGCSEVTVPGVDGRVSYTLAFLRLVTDTE